MLKEASREINSKRYVIQSLPSVKGRSVLVKLLKCVGPSIAQALRGKTSLKDVKLGALSGDDLANVVMELCDRLNEHEFEEICSTFLSYTQVQEHGQSGPTPIVKEFAFTGDYGSMMQWLAFCIEHNYSNFLGGLGLTGPHG